MKKVFTFIFVCLITLGAFGQTNGQFRNGAVFKQPSQADVAVPGNYLPTNSPVYLSPYEDLMGKTYYDVQTNAALTNRFHRFDDGRMVAIWTGGKTIAGTFPDRGTFYNYFDGTQWTSNPDDIVRIEDVRSGWGTYAPLGNGEVIASHDGATGINVWSRATVGTGSWTKKTTVAGADTWPRICVNDGVIHLISCVQETSPTTTNTLYYSKSTDGGETWNPNRVKFANQFPDFNYTDYVYTPDSYIWAEPVNGIIAFSLSSTAGDILIYKSSDNGATWEKKVVWECPVQGHVFGNLFDDMTSPGGAQSLVIDSEGKCHLAFLTNKSHAESDGIRTYFYYSWAYYWNEDLPAFSFPSDPFNTFDPEINTSLQNDERLILPMGFDFIDGDEISDENITSYRSTGMINGISMVAAGPNRMLLALDVQDNRPPFFDPWYLSKIYLCSYKKDGTDWKFDTDWYSDETMKTYDFYTEEIIDNNGWFPLNKNLHSIENNNHPQLTADNEKFYLLYKVDAIPGEAGSSSDFHNPHQGDYTENRYFVYSDKINGPEAEVPPVITTTNLPNGKKGVNYFQILMANTQPVTWSLAEGNLPEGLILEATGVISGKPAEADTVVPTLYTFKVKATNDWGEDEKELSITIDPSVGINAYEISPVKVYPNPANDILYIVNENQQSMQVKLFDFMGREVLNQNITDKTGIDIKKLPAGIYNLTIKYGNTVENRRIVKN